MIDNSICWSKVGWLRNKHTWKCDIRCWSTLVKSSKVKDVCDELRCTLRRHLCSWPGLSNNIILNEPPISHRWKSITIYMGIVIQNCTNCPFNRPAYSFNVFFSFYQCSLKIKIFIAGLIRQLFQEKISLKSKKSSRIKGQFCN